MISGALRTTRSRRLATWLAASWFLILITTDFAEETNLVTVSIIDASASLHQTWSISGSPQTNIDIDCKVIVTNRGPKAIIFRSVYPEQPLGSFYLVVTSESGDV